jgi:hypothetical protein
MTTYATAYAAVSGLKATFLGKPRGKLKRSAEIRFIEFVRPDGYWPYPYSTEQAFQVFRWMVTTGKEYTKFGAPGVTELLSTNPTCLNFSRVHPITSREDLRKRFHYALLSNYGTPFVDQWRKANSISVTESRRLHFPHYTPFMGAGAYESERDIKDALDALLGKSRGKVLNVSLNDCHKRARWVGGVDIVVSEQGFSFNMDYGYEKDSGWNHILAATNKNEPFIDTMHRAIVALAEMTGKEMQAA